MTRPDEPAIPERAANKGAIAHAWTIVNTWLRMDFFGADSRDTGSALTSTIFSQSFFALVVAAMLFEPGQVSATSFAAANLSFSTLLVGIGALGDPQRAHRRRRADQALLGTAPIPTNTLPIARALHGSFYVALITTGMAIPPAILGHWLADGRASFVPLYIVHAIALSSACSGGVALALRIVERVASRGSAMLFAGTLRAVLLGGGFIAFALCLKIVDESVDALPGGATAAWSWPPYWSARALAHPSEFAPMALLLGLLLGLWFANAWIAETPLRSSRSFRRPGGWLARAEATLAGSGPRLGATRFVATMLFRSASFRGRVLPLLGVPVAMTILAFLGDDGDHALFLGMAMQFPAIYLPFLIGFLPSGERKGVGRVFATSPVAIPELARDAIRIALTTRVLTPVLVLATALAWVAGLPILDALLLLSFSWGAAVILLHQQTMHVDAMPFSVDSDEPPAAEFGGILAAGIVLGAAGAAYAATSTQPLIAPIGPALAIVATVLLTRIKTREAS
ncbi:MAG: hypothetical protein KDB80_18230 [Planctomycetes bacterium]|nr:hypothetical protein [Planctomycetota bacterium]